MPYTKGDLVSTTMPKEELLKELKEYYNEEDIDVAVETIAFTSGQILAEVDDKVVIYRPAFKFKHWTVPLSIFDEAVPLP